MTKAQYGFNMESPTGDEEDLQYVLDETRDVDFGCARILFVVGLNFAAAFVIVTIAWLYK